MSREEQTACRNVPMINVRRPLQEAAEYSRAEFGTFLLLGKWSVCQSIVTMD